MSTPDSGEYEYNEDDFRVYIQQLVRRQVRGAVRSIEYVPDVEAGEELLQRAEDVYFCLNVHSLDAAQGQCWKDVAGEGPAAERVGRALRAAAGGDSYAAPLARCLVNVDMSASPDEFEDSFERVARLVLWAMIATPEHERGGRSQAFSQEYLRKR